jgi:hypothetical protein
MVFVADNKTHKNYKIVNEVGLNIFDTPRSKETRILKNPDPSGS